MNSLTVRLLLAWAVFIAVLLGVTNVGLRFLFERSITRRTEAELTADLRQIVRGMAVHTDGTVEIVRKPTDPQFDIVFGGRYWQVADTERVLARSPSLDTMTLPAHADMTESGPGETHWLAGPAGQRLFAVVDELELAEVDSGAKPVLTITTAVDAAEISQDTDQFSSDLVMSLGMLATLLLSGAFAQVTVGLRPLQYFRAIIADVRQGRKRLLEGVFPDEVMPLVAETNALLKDQEAALVNARQRAGDLAHGLKTPLAVMSAKSRYLRRNGEVETADEIERQIALMNRQIERELARTRVRGAMLSRSSRIDVAAPMREIVALLQTLPREPEIEWGVELPERLELAADSEDIMTVAGNLLDNAVKWTKGRIEVKARRAVGSVVIEVEDDGPGVAEDEVDRVITRGSRGDLSVPGSGLGLAIVSDIVGAYGGQLTLTRARLGGLLATVVLPDSGYST